MYSPFRGFPNLSNLRQLQEQLGQMFQGGQSQGSSGDGAGGFGGFPGMGGMGGNGWPFNQGMSPDPSKWMNGFGGGAGAGTGGSLPADIYETPGEVVVVAEIPGLTSSSDVQVFVESKAVVIRGKIERNYGENRQHSLHVTERQMGPFERRIDLPARVKKNGVEARYRNGLLEVRLLKDNSKKSESPDTIRVDFG